jgi:hypothetical protein
VIYKEQKEEQAVSHNLTFVRFYCLLNTSAFGKAIIRQKYT